MISNSLSGRLSHPLRNRALVPMGLFCVDRGDRVTVAGMLLDGSAERERGHHTILFCPLSSELDSFAAGFPQLAVPGSSPSVSDHVTGSQPSGNISNASVSR